MCWQLLKYLCISSLLGINYVTSTQDSSMSLNIELLITHYTARYKYVCSFRPWRGRARSFRWWRRLPSCRPEVHWRSTKLTTPTGLSLSRVCSESRRLTSASTRRTCFRRGPNGACLGPCTGCARPTFRSWAPAVRLSPDAATRPWRSTATQDADRHEHFVQLQTGHFGWFRANI